MLQGVAYLGESHRRSWRVLGFSSLGAVLYGYLLYVMSDLNRTLLGLVDRPIPVLPTLNTKHLITFLRYCYAGGLAAF